MNGFLQRLAQLHLYLGLGLALLLWLIIFAGSVSFYRAELDTLQLQTRAGLSLPAKLPAAPQSTALALRHLQQNAATAQHWYIELPERRSPYLKLHWQLAPESAQQGSKQRASRQGMLMQQYLHPHTGESLLAPRPLRFGATEHQLGGWFFQLHFNLLQLAGQHSRSLVAFAALLWLLLTISGLLSLKGQWRVLFRPLQAVPAVCATRQQLLPTEQTKHLQKHQQLIARRRHQQLALFTLPFALLFALSGWLTQMFSENSAPQQLLYPQNPYQFYTELFPQAQPSVPVAAISNAEPKAGAVPDLAPMLLAAELAFDGRAVGKISINAPGRPQSTVLLSSSAASRVGNQPQTLLFAHAANGQWQQSATLFSAQETTLNAARPLAQLRQLGYGLHQSLYAGEILRFVLFSFGVASCWMIWLGIKAALTRLKPGRWQQLLNVLVPALPGATVLASLLLLGQSLFWPIPGMALSLSQCFMGYWAGSFLLWLVWHLFRQRQRRSMYISF
ncbi:PepSY-associated TM helix domain-containing protein [Rheinheimera sp. 4Y26]|uniref:PepSY-associated TM helix domain-containing protein n=1 Tax=Rheinheimera sp. 4Y26 TaxID=2977811 RepID=UPI0021B0D73A|nr:PepSY-associated TM helix domain-containing protein [Rheinheimera sp. 4Y26]MCT6699770.1 PepSY domain-containing protein [Rheinheimera sp. 4Y26]